MRTLSLFLLATAASAQTLTCDLTAYKSAPGLTAEVRGADLQLIWQGDHDQQLRAILAIPGGQPMIRELAIQKNGAWVVLARELTPEFSIVAGKRRISEQQLAPLRSLNLATNPEVLAVNKWNAFWDAPLQIPGRGNTNAGLPRKPDEIRRAKSSYHLGACNVKIEGARLEASFDGLELGIFAGQLQFTVYKGSSLLRQEAIAKTSEDDIAYKYDAGLKGFAIDDATRVVWQDVARAWQANEFGGAVNTDPVALRARNRLVVVETRNGSIAVFPPPHKFFWAREIELNLGYVYYRKDSDRAFSAGIRQAEHEEEYRAYGVSDEVWNRPQAQARNNINNFALYNAPPGTSQHMAVYYYLSAGDARSTQPAVLAFTHEDRYKAMPGYQVAVSHFHTHFNEMLQDAGTVDYQPAWVPVFRALGINIAMMSDFHGDGHPNDLGPLRLNDQKFYFDGCQRFSDRSFLIMPGEEPDHTLGGHYTMVFPRPVYWTKGRPAGKQYTEQDPKYGRVYHIQTANDELQMLKDEQGLMWQAHPRTKGSSGYPDAVFSQDHFKSDRFLGASYQSLPVDLSEKRICESRCFGTLDDMNNQGVTKYLIAEGDTYSKYPDDETYPHLMVNYVKLDRLPRFNEDWSPILKSMRAGDFWVTSGEVLFRSYGIEGKIFTADVEWTFPLEFAEVVWGDGKTTGRQIVSLTDTAQFGNRKLRIPFDPTGKTWVRLAVWDSAGDGAFTQPVRLN